MARHRLTTIRLNEDDTAALERARADGISASALVRQGLRVVGARYYRVRSRSDVSSTYRRGFLRERAAFERLPKSSVARHRGQWVAVQGGRIADFDDDVDLLRERMWRRSKGRPFFIGQPGHEPEVIDMPGFELE